MKRFLAAVGAALVFSLGAAGPAFADTGTDRNGGSPNVQVDCVLDTSSQQTEIQQGKWLPMNRWGAAVGNYHSRLDSGIDGAISNGAEYAARGLEGVLTSFGSWAMRLGGQATTAADEFDLKCEFAGKMDKASHDIGIALLGSGILAIAFSAAIIVTVRRNRNGYSGNYRVLVRITILAAVTMFLAAAAGRTIVSNDGRTVAVGAGSPADLATRLTTAMDQIADFPNTVLENAFTSMSSSGDTDTYRPGCAAYVDTLIRSDKRDRPQAEIERSVDRMWRGTVMDPWRLVQFGETRSGKRMYCRLLEYNAGKSIAAQQNVQNASTGEIAVYDGFSPFVEPGNTTADNIIFAWAACTSTDAGATWTVTPDWDGIVNHSHDKASMEAACAQWWAHPTGTEWTLGNGSGDTIAFNFEGEADIARDTQAEDDARIMILTAQGHHSSDVVNAFMAAISGASVGGGYTILALAVIVGKTMLWLFIPVLIMLLVVDMFSLKESAADLKSVKMTRFIIGMLGFATFYKCLLSFTAFTASMVYAALGAIPYVGDVLKSLSGAIALVIVHQAFKAAGKPSPFKPGAMLGTAAAFAGAGAGIGIGLDRMMSRGRNTVGGGLRNGLGNRIGRGGERLSKKELARRQTRGGADGYQARRGMGGRDGMREDLAARAKHEAGLEEAKRLAAIPKSDGTAAGDAAREAAIADAARGGKSAAERAGARVAQVRRGAQWLRTDPKGALVGGAGAAMKAVARHEHRTRSADKTERRTGRVLRNGARVAAYAAVATAGAPVIPAAAAAWAAGRVVRRPSHAVAGRAGDARERQLNREARRDWYREKADERDSAPIPLPPPPPGAAPVTPAGRSGGVSSVTKNRS